LAPTLADHVNEGARQVEVLFGHPFVKKFEVYVFPRRVTSNGPSP
jgi:hypothetical protein